jgi:hypothetical protein
MKEQDAFVNIQISFLYSSMPKTQTYTWISHLSATTTTPPFHNKVERYLFHLKTKHNSSDMFFLELVFLFLNIIKLLVKLCRETISLQVLTYL